ncbi:MAG: hypothetical protein Q9217_002622 [Psora testacea]
MLPPKTMTGTLSSDKKLALLDDIDKLRSHGISQYVNLPQLIVCGDQSSGKSSVLEAISCIPFPTKDNLCTRFATEVILRHTSDVAISVAIVPGPGRSDEEQTKLLAFRHNLANVKDFPMLVDNAKSCMGVTNNSSAFSTDVLRLEISGPRQPHLTIVDLPGLIHSENKLQTAADIQIVQNMVYEYMINRRSIILAVISAKNDYANQIVLKLARQVDPQGRRTMGVITKPDTLSIGSESETAFVNLARNMDIAFRLGWHVLKNRSYETRELSTEARDDDERQFLDQGIWKDLARDTVGIYALREKLSKVLFDQIRVELPMLIEDIEGKINSCRKTLARLGPNRVGIDQQRLFLLQISQEFQAISKAALDGSYGHSFFGESRSPDGYTRRLRAVVQNLNVEFAESIRLRGQQRRIVEDNVGLSDPPKGMDTISRAEYIEEIKELLYITRGRELPGMFNPLMVGDLFREQSKPWERLARQHLQNVWQAARSFLDLLISNLADEPTSEALLDQVIDPLMDQKLTEMNQKLEEILKPYQSSHPITYNHYFTETIQKVRETRHEAEIARKLSKFLGHKEGTVFHSAEVKNARVSSLLSALSSRTEADMDRYACSEILDCMEAYYKVAMKSVIDNVAVHAIECCLIVGISDLLSPSSVLQMNQELLCGIAAETHQNQALREQTQRKLAVLQAGLEICRSHADRKSLSMLRLSHQAPRMLTLHTDRAEPSKFRFGGLERLAKRPEPENLEDLFDNKQLSQKTVKKASAGLPESIAISAAMEIVPPSNKVDRPPTPPTFKSAQVSSPVSAWPTSFPDSWGVPSPPVFDKPKKKKDKAVKT